MFIGNYRGVSPHASPTRSALSNSFLLAKPMALIIMVGGFTGPSRSGHPYLREVYEKVDNDHYETRFILDTSPDDGVPYWDKALNRWNDRINKYGIPKYGAILREITPQGGYNYVGQDIGPLNGLPNIITNIDKLTMPNGIIHDIDQTIDFIDLYQKHFKPSSSRFINPAGISVPSSVSILANTPDSRYFPEIDYDGLFTEAFSSFNNYCENNSIPGIGLRILEIGNLPSPDNQWLSYFSDRLAYRTLEKPLVNPN
jgi:hypothetical protein